jgi:signal transduction histidine kinase
MCVMLHKTVVVQRNRGLESVRDGYDQPVIDAPHGPAQRTERTVVVLRALVAALVVVHVGLMAPVLDDQGLLVPALVAAAALVVSTLGGLLALLDGRPRVIHYVGWLAVLVDSIALVTIARVTVQADPSATIAWAFVLWAPFSIAVRSTMAGAVAGSAAVALLVFGETLVGIGSLDRMTPAWTTTGVPMVLIFFAGALTSFAMLSQTRTGQQVRRELDDERDRAHRLREADDVKNTFLAAVSHELRTPLTSILGFAVTMLDRPDIDDEQRERMLRTIVTEAEHLEDILANLLDLDRLTRGKATLVAVEVDPAVLVREAVQHVQRRCGREVELDLASGLRMRLDAAKVERIVENLVGNAVKFTPEDVPVHVQLRPDSRGVVIVVDDGGPGISRELRESVFEPFRRGNDVGVPGTGIGLSLVDRFSRMHGGRAWVEERPGGGCRFQVYLPGGTSTPEPNAHPAKSDTSAALGSLVTDPLDHGGMSVSSVHG